MARKVVEVRARWLEEFPSGPSTTLMLLTTAWRQNSESECPKAHVSVEYIF